MKNFIPLHPNCDNGKAVKTMDTPNNIMSDSPINTFITAYGGEEQLLKELLRMEQKEDKPVSREQMLRLAMHIRDLARAKSLNISMGPRVTEVRPQELECDVVRFQNNKEKWVALVGLLDGYPYEIFTGLQDDDEGIMLPKSVTKGKIIKQMNEDGTKRYDFQFEKSVATRPPSRDSARSSTPSTGTTPSSSAACCVTACP